MKAIALFSGGLDSILAVKYMEKLGIKVIPFYFVNPYNVNDVDEIAKSNKLKIRKIKLDKSYIKAMRKPKYGFGKNLNPCIDCRIFLLKQAKKLMKKLKADFIITGEVIGQRPMSQYKKALDLVEKKSGLKSKLVRPLTGELLEETIFPKEKLLDISGRSRKRQLELAKKFKIKKYLTPAGGCLLTDENFCKKLKDLYEHKKIISLEDIELLKIGRHFRVNKDKIVVGRNEKENKKLEKFKGIKLEPVDFPGPTVLLQGKNIKKAKELLLRYSKKKGKIKCVHKDRKQFL